MRSAAILFALAVGFGVSIGFAGFLSGGRYETVAAGDKVYVVDRFGGDVRMCSTIGCTRLERY